MNQITLSGRLTKDPELTQTASGTSVCRFSIAVNRPYKTEGNEGNVDFFNCSAWRNTAENLCRYEKKGGQIIVMGMMLTRKYKDNQGNERTSYDVMCNNIEFISTAGNESTDCERAQEVNEDGEIVRVRRTSSRVQEARAAENEYRQRCMEEAFDDEESPF